MRGSHDLPGDAGLAELTTHGAALPCVRTLRVKSLRFKRAGAN